MLRSFKWASALAAVTLVTCASLDQDCRQVLCAKTLEGLLGGLIVGLAVAYSKLEALWPRRTLTVRKALCLIRRDACAGLVGGLLTGLALAGLLLLSK